MKKIISSLPFFLFLFFCGKAFAQFKYIKQISVSEDGKTLAWKIEDTLFMAQVENEPLNSRESILKYHLKVKAFELSGNGKYIWWINEKGNLFRSQTGKNFYESEDIVSDTTLFSEHSNIAVNFDGNIAAAGQEGKKNNNCAPGSNLAIIEKKPTGFSIKAGLTKDLECQWIRIYKITSDGKIFIHQWNREFSKISYFIPSKDGNYSEHEISWPTKKKFALLNVSADGSTLLITEYSMGDYLSVSRKISDSFPTPTVLVKKGSPEFQNGYGIISKDGKNIFWVVEDNKSHTRNGCGQFYIYNSYCIKKAAFENNNWSVNTYAPVPARMHTGAITLSNKYLYYSSNPYLFYNDFNETNNFTSFAIENRKKTNYKVPIFITSKNDTTIYLDTLVQDEMITVKLKYKNDNKEALTIQMDAGNSIYGVLNFASVRIPDVPNSNGAVCPDMEFKIPGSRQITIPPNGSAEIFLYPNFRYNYEEQSVTIHGKGIYYKINFAASVVKKRETPKGNFTYLYTNGQKMEEMLYSVKEGIAFYSSWYKSGKKKTSGQYKNGKVYGSWTHWYEHGRKMAEIHYDEKGNITKQKTWLPNEE